MQRQRNATLRALKDMVSALDKKAWENSKMPEPMHETRAEIAHRVFQRACQVDRSAAAVQREFDVGRSEIAAARLKRAARRPEAPPRHRRLGTAA